MRRDAEDRNVHTCGNTARSSLLVDGLLRVPRGADQCSRYRGISTSLPRPLAKLAPATKPAQRCTSTVASSSRWRSSSDAGTSDARRSSQPSVTPRVTTGWIAVGAVAAVATRCMPCCARQGSTSAGCCGRSLLRGWRPFFGSSRSWHCMLHSSATCCEYLHVPLGEQIGDSSGDAGGSRRVSRQGEDGFRRAD